MTLQIHGLLQLMMVLASWGAGVRITDKFSVIPIGSWFTVSFDVYSPVDITWNNDTNNFPIGTTSGTNDNDDVALRKIQAET